MYYRRCSLRFDIEENTIIEAFVRFRFASVAITTPDLRVRKFLFSTPRQTRARISKLLMGPGIDSRESITAYVAWQAGMNTLFQIGS